MSLVEWFLAHFAAFMIGASFVAVVPFDRDRRCRRRSRVAVVGPSRVTAPRGFVPVDELRYVWKSLGLVNENGMTETDRMAWKAQRDAIAKRIRAIESALSRIDEIATREPGRSDDARTSREVSDAYTSS